MATDWKPEHFRAPPQGFASSRPGPRRTPELVKRAKELRAEGHTYRQIGRLLHVSVCSARNYVKEQ
jgi:hypothetical protein